MSVMKEEMGPGKDREWVRHRGIQECERNCCMEKGGSLVMEKIWKGKRNVIRNRRYRMMKER